MDGFALRSSRHARTAAGRAPDRRGRAGAAFARGRGGDGHRDRRLWCPEGADAVIPFEYVVENDNTIEIEHAVERGANVRPAGGDIGVGETVVEAGARLEARHLAALAAAGIPEVRVARRPRAAVVVTGSELRPPGEALAPGQIYEANGILLEAQLRLGGGRGRAGELGRGRGGSPSRGSRARARRGRPRDLGRRLGRPARPRSGDPGRARRRGGVLGRLGEAGQADLVRRRRKPARLRPAREPGLGARRLRALRPAGSAGSPGQRRSRPTVRARSARLAADAEPRPRRARTGPGSATVRRPGRRTARGTRVAHDRAGSRARTRSSSFHVETATWRRASPSSFCGSRRRRPAALARPGACGSSRRARPCASVASQARAAVVRPRSGTARSAGR